MLCEQVRVLGILAAVEYSDPRMGSEHSPDISIRAGVGGGVSDHLVVVPTIHESRAVGP